MVQAWGTPGFEWEYECSQINGENIRTFVYFADNNPAFYYSTNYKNLSYVFTSKRNDKKASKQIEIEGTTVRSSLDPDRTPVKEEEVSLTFGNCVKVKVGWFHFFPTLNNKYSLGLKYFQENHSWYTVD